MAYFTNANFDLLKSDISLLDSEGRSRRLLAGSEQEFVVVTVIQSNQKKFKEDELKSLSELIKSRRESSQTKDSAKFDYQIVSADLKEDREALLAMEKQVGAEKHFLSDPTQILTNDLGLLHNLDSAVIHRRTRKIVNRLKITTTPLVFEKKPSHLPDYAKEIAPIFVRNCITCHREGGLGSWSMKNHASVLRWQKMIREVILTKRMPPAQSDHYYQTYSNEIRPSEPEIKKLITWIDGGAPLGKGDDPLARQKAASQVEFALGPPDLILDLPEQKIQADANEYVTVLKLKWPLDKPARIRGMDVQTDNVPATHHISSYYLLPVQGQPGKSNVAMFDAGYIPGYQPTYLPYKSSYLIPPLVDLRVSPHLVPTGKNETVNMRMAFYFDKSKEANELVHCGASSKEIDIAPFEPDYKKISRVKLREDIRVIQVGTHMHSRGRFIRYTAELPNQEKVVLLSIPDYTRNWQREYILQKPVFLPKGTILTCAAQFDNSRRNPLVQHPEKRINYGWFADDEMLSCSCFGLREMDYRKAVGLPHDKLAPIPADSDRDFVEPVSP